MKKILSILLIVFFITPFAGYYSYLNYQKYLVKKQVKKQIIAGIDKKNLVLLSFSVRESKNLLKWKHSKEFQFKGQMYDIVEKLQKNDSIFYWCWWDCEETGLNKELNQLTDLTMGRNTGKDKNLPEINNLFKKLYYSEINNDIFSDEYLLIDYKTDNPILYKSEFIAIPDPPPWKI